jgi:hypothetical protein
MIVYRIVMEELHAQGECYDRCVDAPELIAFSRYANFDSESVDGASVEDQSCLCVPKQVKRFFGKRQAATKKLQRSKKVEPKTLFANERTYLQWMQAGVLLTTLSLGLLSLEGESSRAGYFMAPIAILVMAWSTLR